MSKALGELGAESMTFKSTIKPPIVDFASIVPKIDMAPFEAFRESIAASVTLKTTIAPSIAAEFMRIRPSVNLSTLLGTEAALRHLATTQITPAELRTLRNGLVAAHNRGASPAEVAQELRDAVPAAAPIAQEIGRQTGVKFVELLGLVILVISVLLQVYGTFNTTQHPELSQQQIELCCARGGTGQLGDQVTRAPFPSGQRCHLGGRLLAAAQIGMLALARLHLQLFERQQLHRDCSTLRCRELPPHQRGAEDVGELISGGDHSHRNLAQIEF
jgi:hypothetical protein